METSNVSEKYMHGNIKVMLQCTQMFTARKVRPATFSQLIMTWQSKYMALASKKCRQVWTYVDLLEPCFSYVPKELPIRHVALYLNC